MPNIRCTIISKTGTIDLSGSKQDLWIATNTKAKRKMNLVVDGYDKTSVALSGNCHVDVSLTEKKIILVGLDDDISNKSIVIRSSITAIYLPNGTGSAQLKDTPIYYSDTRNNNYRLITYAKDIVQG